MNKVLLSFLCMASSESSRQDLFISGYTNWSIEGSRTQLEQTLNEGTRQLCQDTCIFINKDFCVCFALRSLKSLQLGL